MKHVMDVQQSKKELIRIFLSPHGGGQSNSSIERLQFGSGLIIMAEPAVASLITVTLPRMVLSGALEVEMDIHCLV